jgi:hypothetical protein
LAWKRESATPVALANRALDWLGLERTARTLALEIPLDTDAMELGLRLIKAFTKMPGKSDRLALVEAAERLAGAHAGIKRL